MQGQTGIKTQSISLICCITSDIFQKTCLLDSLKELLLIRNIMTFVDTQQHFVDTQQHFVVTQQIFAHLDVCCYTTTFCAS
jgi:hypothetical protein